MPIIDLPQGRVQYRLAGPAKSASPPVVFVHGLLVNWSSPGTWCIDVVV